MKDAKNVVCCVVDNGLFTEFASVLARTYKTVYYCPAWEEAFPMMQCGRIGEGIEGLKVISSPFAVISACDLFVFPDLNYGHLQVYLRSIGKAVWGSGLGEELEQDRVKGKAIQARVGLPVGDYEVVRGTSKLREYLKKHDDVYVKISKWRGSFESFNSINYRLAEPLLDQIDKDLGVFQHCTDFVVEKALPDKIELGIDAYTIDGKQPNSLLGGIEIKDCGYVGVFQEMDKFPKPLVDVSRAFEPIFKKYGYRGSYSTEVRIGKDQKPYLIDFTTRLPSPPNELYQEFYTNMAEIVWQGANGNCIDPIPAAKYGAQIRLHSDWANTHWQPVDFPMSIRRNVKLVNPVCIEGRYYVVPQYYGMSEIGSVIGWGDTMEEAIEQAKEMAKQVEGHGVTAQSHSMDEAESEIAKGEEYGIRMFE